MVPEPFTLSRDPLSVSALVRAQVAPYWAPSQFVDSLFVQRMRTVDDRRAVLALYGAWLGGYEPGAVPGASAPPPRPITARPITAPGTALKMADELMADELEEYVRGGREIVAFLRDGFDWAHVRL